MPSVAKRERLSLCVCMYTPEEVLGIRDFLLRLRGFLIVVIGVKMFGNFASGAIEFSIKIPSAGFKLNERKLNCDDETNTVEVRII